MFLGTPDYRTKYFMNYTKKAVAALQSKIPEIQQKMLTLMLGNEEAMYLPLGAFLQFLYGDRSDGLSPPMLDLMEESTLEIINDRAFGPFYTEVC